MNNNKIQKATASWIIKLTVNCPHCDYYIDLADSDDAPALHNGDPLFMSYEPGVSYKEDEGPLKYQEPIECKECGEEFLLDGVEF